MTLKLKKIIAREFLILISIFALSGVLLLIIIAYNSILQGIINTNKIEISQEWIKKRELISNYNEKIKKQEALYDAYKAFAFLPVSKNNSDVWLPPPKPAEYFNSQKKTYDDYQSLWNSLLLLKNTDSLWSTWNTTKHKEFILSLRFKDEKAFERFLIRNTIDSTDLKNLAESEIISQKIASLYAYEHSLKSKKLELDYFYFYQILTIMLLIVCFPMRFLIQAIRWSIITLKAS